jgi:hypothetical protein
MRDWNKKTRIKDLPLQHPLLEIIFPLFFLFSPIQAQIWQTAVPLIHNFTPDQYLAGRQNWQIA